jgi:DNA-binding LacI/PurR family transcriptional regulator
MKQQKKSSRPTLKDKEIIPGVELTTISHPKHTLGRLAVEQHLEKIKGESDNVVKKSFIDPVLVIRKTCGYHAWKERRIK